MTRHLTGIAAAVAVGIVSAPANCGAQPPGMAYVFGGPTVVQFGDPIFALSGGFGGEGAVGKSVTAGGEIQGIVAWPTGAYREPSGLVLLSANGSYHFAPARNHMWQPFITGGISTPAATAVLGFFNAGGGAYRWFNPHYGIRLEARDYFGAGPEGVASLMLGFRVGFMFR
jgi:hypothetical protein